MIYLLLQVHSVQKSLYLIVIPGSTRNPISEAGFPLQFTPYFDTGRE